MFSSVRDFANMLEAAGELARVSCHVSPLLEIAEIADRVSKQPAPHPPSAPTQKNDPRFHSLGGYAIMFENVEGSDMPVLINAFGSYRRMEMALGCHGEVRGLEDGHTTGGFEGVADRIRALVQPQPPRTAREAIQRLSRFASLRSILPRMVRNAPCQEIMFLHENVNLGILPIIRCWPLDGDLESVGFAPDVNRGIPGIEIDNPNIRGRYITLAGVHTIHPDDENNPRPASHNIGMYRVQMLGRRHMAMHWHMHHDGAAHWRAWKSRGRKMPVAIALGGESVLPYAATCPLPPGISELLMAGFLNRKGIPLVRCKTVPIRVPANAEIVIEGFVSHEAGPIGYDPRHDGPLGPGAVFEGPFGDHTGFYSMPDRYPILEVTAITHRRDPIYPTTIVGLPPQEDYFLGKATERIFFPLLKTLIHDIEDYDLPLFGAFHNCAVLKIRKQYPLHARRVMHAVWGAGQMAWTKNIIVVDDDIDVHDTLAVMRRVAERCDPARDIESVFGPLDILDHAAPRLGAGMKTGFDATMKIPGEDLPASEIGGIVRVGRMPAIEADHAPRSLPDQEQAQRFLTSIRAIDGVADARLPESLGRGWLLIQGKSDRSGQARAIIDRVWKTPTESPPPYIIVVGPDANLDVEDDVLFHWCANVAAERDSFRSDLVSLESQTSVAVGGAHWRGGYSNVRLAFDATSKTPTDTFRHYPVRPWPPIIRMDSATKHKVDARWDEYGLI